jgi:hypothetical protein
LGGLFRAAVVLRRGRGTTLLTRESTRKSKAKADSSSFDSVDAQKLDFFTGEKRILWVAFSRRLVDFRRGKVAFSRKKGLLFSC